ncbi:GNAT superfamily N-acetyltransferase [Phyllobacterium ifriqiyense]
MTAQCDIEFRKAEREDADAVGHLVRNAYARWVNVIGREPRPMAADYLRAVQEHDVELLIVKGEFVGVIETIRHLDHLWIENVAVAPHRQGQGWGRQLLVFADRKAVGLGCHEIRLLTNEAFATNVALYERSGYRMDKKEPLELGGIVVYMSKPLHSSSHLYQS